MTKFQAANNEQASNTDIDSVIIWTLRLLRSNAFLFEGFPQSAGKSLFLRGANGIYGRQYKGARRS